MVDARVAQVSADATEAPSPNTRSDALTGRDRPVGPLAFRALVDLKDQHLQSDGQRYSLAPGMQVVAEIKLGSRLVIPLFSRNGRGSRGWDGGSFDLRSLCHG